MVKVQKKIEEFSRVRLGKPERVREHNRGYDIKPKLTLKEEQRVKESGSR